MRRSCSALSLTRYVHLHLVSLVEKERERRKKKGSWAEQEVLKSMMLMGVSVNSYTSIKFSTLTAFCNILFYILSFIIDLLIPLLLYVSSSDLLIPLLLYFSSSDLLIPLLLHFSSSDLLPFSPDCDSHSQVHFLSQAGLKHHCSISCRTQAPRGSCCLE